MLKIKDKVYLEAKKKELLLKLLNEQMIRKQNYFELQDIVDMIGMLECCWMMISSRFCPADNYAQTFSIKGHLRLWSEWAKMVRPEVYYLNSSSI